MKSSTWRSLQDLAVDDSEFASEFEAVKLLAEPENHRMRADKIAVMRRSEYAAMSCRSAARLLRSRLVRAAIVWHPWRPPASDAESRLFEIVASYGGKIPSEEALRKCLAENG